MAVPILELLTEPAAGNNIAVINPAGGYSYKLCSVMYTLTTSATVANRFPQIFIDDNNGHDIALVINGTALAASDSVVVSAFPNAGYSLNFGDFLTWLTLPDIVISPTWRVLIGAATLQAGDQVSGATLTYVLA